MSGALPLLPLYAFMVWTGRKLRLPLVHKTGLKIKSVVFWVITRRRVVIIYRRFGLKMVADCAVLCM
jgi:hypothetical protein